jgi:hypothetical protein
MCPVTVPPVSAPYRPGQQQWPDNRPQRPERPPPIQFRQEQPAAKPNKALQWGLRIAGLVAVAVVSGLIWTYVTGDDTSTPSTGGDPSGTQQPEGRYQFTAHEDMPSPDKDTDCAKHAYGDIQKFLQDTPCDHLTRQLFVTKVNGRTIYTSVSVVTMPDEDKADALRDKTDENGSGNVSDVVRDGLVEIDGLDRLSSNDGYASKQTGRDVIIIEADLAPKDKSGNEEADQNLLDDVCEDALLLAAKLDPDAGLPG